MKLLHENEVPAFEVSNADGASRLLLLCDHASCSVPRRLNNLGLGQAQLEDHIGWDAGAADLARDLSNRLNAPLIRSRYSRLVIDCNRAPDSAESIPEQSDGMRIPGNADLSRQQRAEREGEIFQPYHHAISRLVDAKASENPVLVSIHSFTPMLQGRLRPWSIGVCFGQDRRLADLFLLFLGQLLDSGVGNNQPYSIEAEVDYTLPYHAGRRNLPHVMLELSRDQLRSPAAIARWGERLALVWNKSEPLLP